MKFEYDASYSELSLIRSILLCPSDHEHLTPDQVECVKRFLTAIDDWCEPFEQLLRLYRSPDVRE